MEAITKSIRTSLVNFLNEKLNGVVDSETVEEYIDEWISSKKVVKKTTPSVTPNVSVPKTKSQYMKLRNAELQEMCRARGLSTVGTKANFVERLLEATDSEVKPQDADEPQNDPQNVEELDDVPNDEEAVFKPPRSKSRSKQPQRIKSTHNISDQDDDEPIKPASRRKSTLDKEPRVKKPTKKSKPPVHELVVQPSLDLRFREEIGRYINEETGFVFENDNAIGKMDTEGNIVRLDKADIATCISRSIPYSLETYDSENED